MFGALHRMAMPIYALNESSFINGLEKLDPGDPIKENVYKLSPQQKRQYGIGSLPSSLKEALDSFESDRKFLEHVFTKDLLETYIELKYKEHAAFSQTPTAWEVSMYSDA